MLKCRALETSGVVSIETQAISGDIKIETMYSVYYLKKVGTIEI